MHLKHARHIVARLLRHRYGWETNTRVVCAPNQSFGPRVGGAEAVLATAKKIETC